MMKQFTEEQEREAERIKKAHKLIKMLNGIQYAIYALNREFDNTTHEARVELDGCRHRAAAQKALAQMSDDEENNNKVLHEYMESAGAK